MFDGAVLLPRSVEQGAHIVAEGGKIRLIVRDRQHCHKAFHAQAFRRGKFLISVEALGEGVSALGFFTADIDLNEDIGADAGFKRTRGDFGCKLVAVDGVNEISFADEVFYLVGLQMSDEVSSPALNEFEFIAELLHFIFADIGDAGFNGAVDFLGRSCFGSGDEGDFLAEAVAFL